MSSVSAKWRESSTVGSEMDTKHQCCEKGSRYLLAEGTTHGDIVGCGEGEGAVSP